MGPDPSSALEFIKEIFERGGSAIRSEMVFRLHNEWDFIERAHQSAIKARLQAVADLREQLLQVAAETQAGLACDDLPAAVRPLLASVQPALVLLQQEASTTALRETARKWLSSSPIPWHSRGAVVAW